MDIHSDATEPFEPEPLIDGRYRVLSVLGRGGFGEVKLVEDTLRRQRKVALKTILPQHSGTPDFKMRFDREIDILRTLQHEGIPAIINDGLAADGTFYFTMEYVEGVTLSGLVRKGGPLAPTRLARTTQQLTRILDYAHSKGVVHRDLKPGNILVTGAGTDDERIHVLDFGIAKLMEGPDSEAGASLHTAGFIGTPEYASPEQVQGVDDLDFRSDVYALGILIYYLATGKFPFSGTTRQEVATKRLTTPPRPLAPTEAPREIRTIVEGLLQLDREKRPPLADVQAALSSLLGEIQEERRGNRRLVLGSIAVTGVALAALAGFALTAEDRDPNDGPGSGSTLTEVGSSGPNAQESPAGGNEAPLVKEIDHKPAAEVDENPVAKNDGVPQGGDMQPKLKGPEIEATVPGQEWRKTFSIDGQIAGEELEDLTLKIDGVNVPVVSLGSFHAEIDLGEGTSRSIEFIASLPDGRRTTRLFDVERVEAPLSEYPKFEIDGQGEELSTSELAATITGRVVSPRSFEVTVEGAPLEIDASGAFEFHVEDLAFGLRRIRFTAIDEEGLESEEVIEIRRLRPTLEIALDLAEDAYEVAAGVTSIEIKGDITGWYPGRDVTVVVSKDHADIEEGRFEHEVALAPGETPIPITVNDDGGASAFRIVTITRRAPLVPKDARPAQGALYSGDRPLHIEVGDRGVVLALVEPDASTGIEPFYISEAEISCAQADGEPRRGGDDGDLPKTDISPADADAIAQSMGGTLPTLDQWRLAATGGSLTVPTYPFGNTWAAVRVACRGLNLTGPVPVRDPAYASGRTPGLGLWHMAGNVAEWVTVGAGKFIPMGGHYDSPKERCEIAFEPRLTGANAGRPKYGFRIVIPAPSK